MNDFAAAPTESSVPSVPLVDEHRTGAVRLELGRIEDADEDDPAKVQIALRLGAETALTIH